MKRPQRFTVTAAQLHHLGDLVEVHAFGRWYRGRVIRKGGTRVVVRYRTGSGAEHDKAVNVDKVRKANLPTTADAPLPPVRTPVRHVTESIAAPKPKSADVRPVLKKLLAAGWTFSTIAKRLDTWPGLVWYWNEGRRSMSALGLEALLGVQPPAPKVTTGSIRLKQVLAAKEVLVLAPDTRQLMLDLRSAIDAALSR